MHTMHWYNNLYDKLFSYYSQDGLVKSNMEKLTFYVLSSPEKLDRVGEYLFQKVSRDIYRKKNGLVFENIVYLCSPV